MLVSGETMWNPRTRSGGCLAVATAALGFSCPSRTLAQAEPDPVSWDVRIAAFVWLSNVDGRIGSGGIPVSAVDSSLHAMPAVRVEITHGRVGFVGEAQRATTSGSDEAAGVPVFTLEITHLELGTQLRLGGGNGEARVPGVVSSLRLHGILRHGADPLLEAIYVASWVHSLNGASGDHIIHFPSLAIYLPIPLPVGVGAEVIYATRNSYYRDFADVHRRNPQFRLFATLPPR